MNKKIVNAIIGSGFIISSAILLGAKYISEALNDMMTFWGRTDSTIMEYMPIIMNAAIISTFIIGIIFIALCLDYVSSDNNDEKDEKGEEDEKRGTDL